MSVEAVYEHGLLRPVVPLSLADGERVKLFVIPSGAQAGEGSPASILARIAALPREGATDDFSGRDHDKVLYGTANT